MAAERDLELLDDYLANRMDAPGRSAFEQKINSDPELKSELELQRKFIEGIRQVRISELKTMMNNIPIPAGSTGSIAIGAKVAIVTMVAAVVGAGIFYAVRTDQKPSDNSNAIENTKDSAEEKAQTPVDETQETTEQGTHEDSPVVSGEEGSLEQAPVESPKPIKKKKKVSPATPADPKIEVFDPSEEGKTSQPSEDLNDIGLPRSAESPALAVDVLSDNKRYTFHYQFDKGDLKLYGPFEKDLYEILEFFSGDKRTVFLYYGGNYYQLREADQGVKPLVSITEPTLLKKLKEYRNQ